MFKLSKKKKEEVAEQVAEDQLAKEVAQSTEEIEAEKERKKFEREERKFLKERERISQKRQRFVAPILLLLTIIISYVIWAMSR